MRKERLGRVLRGVGGLYTVLCYDDTLTCLDCRAKGVLHREEEKLSVGDMVTVLQDTETPDSVAISEIHPRKNLLIRPPLSNLDFLYICIAAKRPAPVPETVDKLLAIAAHHHIQPILVLTKGDLADASVGDLCTLYRQAGYPVFVTCAPRGEGLEALLAHIKAHLSGGCCAAFAGASGVGKSTLLNRLFPGLSLATGEISKKIERGKHTTRHVELFALDDSKNPPFIADTPGFSLLDFSRFDFFSLEQLPFYFPDLVPYYGACRYADCTHTGEGPCDCAVIRAAKEGEIAPSRLASYQALYRTIKAKKPYE